MPDKGPQFHTEKSGQMALFRQDASMLSDKARYPRGYTPERMREVNDALSDTKLGIVEVDPFNRRSFTAMSNLLDQNRDANPREEAAKIKETLARSTVPAEDLRGLRGIHTNNAVIPEHISGRYETKKNDGRGSIFIRSTMTAPKEVDYDDYDSSGYLEPVRQDTGFINDDGQTLIHELGHHVDNKKGNLKKIALATNNYKDFNLGHKGAGEGRADAYADQHFVNDRRFPKATDNRVEEGGYTGERFRNLKDFWDSYSKHRGIATKEQVNQAYQPPLF